ncbi:MAG TPA: SDR family oxidoreductase [Bryobacteraceae bacterium]|nr:SDR family oxidoreductase [Bryobacteraceae bacterium]
MATQVEDPKTQDPRKAGPQGQEAQSQSIPGTDADLKPGADHGEQSYKGYGRLQDMVAIVTGGDSGIGRAVCIAYAREGAHVVIPYLEEHEDAQETVKWVEQAGRRAVLMPGDIQDERHCKEIIEKTFSEFGRIDILVNNAAFQNTHESIEEWPTDEFERCFRTNVFAMFYLCKAAMPRMKPGSSVINTASIQAYDPKPSLLPYSATKAAIVNFTKALSHMTEKTGIRVNAVAPGPVWTPLIPSTFPPEEVEKFGKNTQFGRAAQPAEMAPVFVFLASSDASFATGEVYGLTGGKTPF